MSYNPISKNELKDITLDMRYDILKMVKMCGKQNGHLGGCLSAVEILAVLYTQIMNINSVAHSNLSWVSRDRFIMSKGHGGIAMYAAMKHVGLINQSMIEESIRGENSVLFRHPKRNVRFGIECSVGSLGMGIGYGIGLAESFIRKKTNQKVYVMLGDGECNEGAVWESAAYAGHRRLDNLVIIIDMNGLQLDGTTREVLAMDNMSERWKAFGFETVDVDGHDINALLNAFKTNHDGRPLAIIAHTIKGKGISFAENRVEWHDNYLSEELYKIGINELGDKDLSEIRQKAQDRFEKCVINNEDETCFDISLDESVEDINNWSQLGSKNVIGEISSLLAKKNDKFTLIYSDCANRIGIKKLKELYPEKCYEVGISEQNQISMAAAMAHEGFCVYAVAYAPFITSRVLDQIKVNLAYMEAPVCLIGLGSGVSSSDLGATHTSFEDVACLRCLPNLLVNTPSDTYEIAKSMEWFSNSPTPMYLRITISNPESRIHFDKIEKYSPKDFEVIKEGKDAVVLVCGSIIDNVLNAEKNIKDLGYSIEIINVRTIKPFNEELLNHILLYEKIITIEEHSILGGLGGTVAEFVSCRKATSQLKIIGINDEYFKADVPQDIIKKIGLDALGLKESIVDFLSK